jgi:transposase
MLHTSKPTPQVASSRKATYCSVVYAYLREGVSKRTHPVFLRKAQTFSSTGFVISQSFCNFSNGSFPQRIDEDIAINDPVHIVNSIVESLNLDNFKKLYKQTGRCPYHPKMMLKVILYAYMNNIYSCRGIEKLLFYDIHRRSKSYRLVQVELLS